MNCDWDDFVSKQRGFCAKVHTHVYCMCTVDDTANYHKRGWKTVRKLIIRQVLPTFKVWRARQSCPEKSGLWQKGPAIRDLGASLHPFWSVFSLVPSSKPGVGLKKALHASPFARNLSLSRLFKCQGDRGWRECEGHQWTRVEKMFDYYWLLKLYELSLLFLLPCQKTFNLSRDTIKFWVFRILYYYCLPGSVLFSFFSPSPPCGGLKSKFLDTPQCNSQSVLLAAPCRLPDLTCPAGVSSRPVRAF